MDFNTQYIYSSIAIDTTTNDVGTNVFKFLCSNHTAFVNIHDTTLQDISIVLQIFVGDKATFGSDDVWNQPSYTGAALAVATAAKKPTLSTPCLQLLIKVTF